MADSGFSYSSRETGGHVTDGMTSLGGVIRNEYLDDFHTQFAGRLLFSLSTQQHYLNIKLLVQISSHMLTHSSHSSCSTWPI